MAITMRDASIIRKYTDKVSVVQAYFDLPSGIPITVSYEPPAGYYVMMVDVAIGDQIYGLLTADVYLDGTSFFSVRSSGWTSNATTREEYPTFYAKHKMEVKLLNYDTMTHTVDFAFIVILIPEANFESVMKQLSMDDIREQNEKMISLLTDIRDWFMKPLKK